MKDKKILKELRLGPMKSMKDDEYAMIEEEVNQKGIAGLKGYAKSMVEKSMREMAYAMKDSVKKATSVKVGDMVSWNSSGGSASGKVVRVISSGKINVPDSSFSIEGTEDDAAALIQLYRDGKPTETKVGHKVSTLKKNSNLAKHGNHDQGSHGAWANGKYNTDDSEGENSSEPKNYKDKKPKISYNDNDTEGEFDNNADDPRWMDDMDILRPPKRSPK
jgi:hypothetical protein